MKAGAAMREADNKVVPFKRPERPEPPPRRRGVESAGLWERRRQVRKPALWVGKLTTPAGTHDCRVLNLSRSGARIEINTHANPDESVTLTLDLLGAFVGSVKWQKDRCIGVSFNERRFTTTRSRTFLPGDLRLP